MRAWTSPRMGEAEPSSLRADKDPASAAMPKRNGSSASLPASSTTCVSQVGQRRPATVDDALAGECARRRPSRPNGRLRKVWVGNTLALLLLRRGFSGFRAGIHPDQRTENPPCAAASSAACRPAGARQLQGESRRTRSASRTADLATSSRGIRKPIQTDFADWRSGVLGGVGRRIGQGDAQQRISCAIETPDSDRSRSSAPSLSGSVSVPRTAARVPPALSQPAPGRAGSHPSAPACRLPCPRPWRAGRGSDPARTSRARSRPAASRRAPARRGPRAASASASACPLRGRGGRGCRAQSRFSRRRPVISAKGTGLPSGSTFSVRSACKVSSV